MKVRVGALLGLAVLGTGTGVTAGALSATGLGPLPPELRVAEPRFDCTHRFTGAFAEGDAEAIIAAAPSLLCLDSPGGSLVEALKLTSWMKDNPLATKVERDAACESACALVFMAGNRLPVEGRSAYFWRVLEPGGRLGFHAPSLAVPDGNYTEATVTAAYDVATTSIARVIADLAQRGDLTGPAMKLSLLGAMLATPPGRMMYVDTVDKAGRWDITVGPLADSGLPAEADLGRVCSNAQAWANDQSAARDWVPDFWRSDIETTERFLSGRVTLSEISGDGCAITLDLERGAEAVAIEMAYEGVAGYRPIMRLDPETPLAGLPFDPRPAEEVTCLIRRNGAETDRQVCHEARRAEGDIFVRTYRWPSGARTVIELDGWGNETIDGAQTYLDERGGAEVCWAKEQTGDTFCILR